MALTETAQRCLSIVLTLNGRQNSAQRSGMVITSALVGCSTAASLYALKDLARDDPRGSCREAVQLLSAYLRWASPNVVAADAKPSTTSDASVDEIWVAAGMVATVTRLCKSQPEISIDVHAVNLRGAYLTELVANRSELSGTKFDGSTRWSVKRVV